MIRLFHAVESLSWRVISLTTLFLYTCLCTVPTGLVAQSLFLDSVNTSGFPLLTAQVRAFDAAGNRITSGTGFTLRENGATRPVTVSNCVTAETKPFSVVLTIDISGSMGQPRNIGGQLFFPLDIAKAAANTFLASLPNDGSECAITAFESNSYLISDFTNDRALLQAGINSLYPLQGTNYDDAFNHGSSGALNIIARAKNQNKAIIFLTDGLSSTNSASVIARARALGVRVFCVTVGLPAPQVLVDIAQGTGGRFYENVNSSKSAGDIYRALANLLRIDAPCTISWMSDISCNTDSRIVTLQHTQVPGITASARYVPSVALSTQVRISPNFVGMGGVSPGTTSPPQQVRIAFSNASATSLRITNIRSSDTAFKVTLFSSSMPPAFTLRPGTPDSSQIVDIRYTAKDSSYHFTTFTIETDVGCKLTFIGTAGYRGTRPGQNAEPLRLTHPNGGQEFLVGIDTVITWTGIAPTDTVSLEYSTDAGRSWKLITDRALGLRHAWKVPDDTSRRCLMRVTQKNNAIESLSPDSAMVLSGHGVEVTSAQFDKTANVVPPGQIPLAVSTDRSGRVFVWDALRGVQSQSPIQLRANSVTQNEASFSSVNNILGATANGEAIIMFANRPSANIPNVSTSDARGIRFNPAKPLQFVITPGANDAGTGILVYTLDTAANTYNSISLGLQSRGFVRIADFLPNGKGIVAAISNKVRLWLYSDSVENDNQVPIEWTAPDARNVVYANAQFTNGVLRIAASCSGGIMDRSPKIFFLRIASNGAALEEIPGLSAPFATTGEIKMANFDRTGQYLTAAVKDEAFVWNLANGEQIILKNAKGHTATVNSAFFSNDNPPSRVITSSVDGTAMIWYIFQKLPLQQDQSDSLWAIVRPIPNVFNVDMKRASVGTSKDSICVAIMNPTRYALPIKSVQLRPRRTGAALPFSIVSGGGSFTLNAGDTTRIEFRYTPTTIGRDTAEIVFTTEAGDVFTSLIVGEGVQLSLVSINFDFGNVFVGTQRDTTIRAVIRNTGTIPATLTNAQLLGSNGLGVFRFANALPNSITLAARGTGMDSLVVNIVFRPVILGPVSVPLSFLVSETGQITTATIRGTGIQEGALLESVLTTASPAAPVCDTASFLVPLRNIGTKELTIETTGASIRTLGGGISPDFVITSQLPMIIPANSTRAIVVRFLARTRGMAQGFLTITSSSLGGDVVVNLAAHYVRDSLTFSRRSLNLGAVEPFQTTNGTLVAQNLGNQNYTRWIGNARMMSTTNFTIQTQDSPPNATLSSNATSTLQINFLGGQAGRTYNDFIIFAPDCSTGRGKYDTISVSVTVNARPRLVVTASPVPLTTCASAGRFTVSIANTGTTSATIAQVSVGEPFSIVSAPASIPVGGSTNIEVTYTLPTQGMGVSGVFTDSVRIREFSTGVIAVGLSVTRQVVDYTISPRVLDFPRLEANMASTASVMITNNGSLPLDVASALAGRFGAQARFFTFSPTLPIQAGATQIINVTFAGGVGNQTFSAAFPFAQTFSSQGTVLCSRFDTLFVNASTIGRTGELSFTNTSANANEKIAIRVFLKNRTNIPVGTIITDTLRTNATMLFPQPPTPRGQHLLGERVIPLRWKVASDDEAIPLEIVSSDAVRIDTAVRFLIMTGNDSLATVRVTGTPQSRSPGMLITTAPVSPDVCKPVVTPFTLAGTHVATFCLLGLPYISGNNFVVSSVGTFSIMDVRPQPVPAELTLDIWSREAELYTIRIIDAFGRDAMPEKRLQLMPGKTNPSIVIPETNLMPRGVYILHVRNARELATRRIMIVR